jgi:hypothetical protein
VTALWAEEAGDSAHPLVAVIHGSMDRSAGMLKLSRRLDAACFATTGGGMAVRSRTPDRSRWMLRWTTSSPCWLVGKLC